MENKDSETPATATAVGSTILFDSPRSIWKWPLKPDATLDLPKGATILTVQCQNGEPQLFAMVNPSAPKEMRRFKTFGTGHDIDEDPGRYVATFQMHGGSLVFHVFESNSGDQCGK